MSSSKNSQVTIHTNDGGGPILGDDTSQYVSRQAEEGWPDLSPVEAAFAHRYCVNGYSHREAAEHVGRNAANGIKMLRIPLVRCCISWIQREQHTESLITKDFVEAQMMELYEKASGDKSVAVIDSDCVEHTVKVFNGQLCQSILKEFSSAVGFSKIEKDKTSRIHIHLDENALTGRKTVTIEEGEVVDE